MSNISWTAVRQATLVSVFLSYLLNFTLQWMARQAKEEKITFRIRNLHFKVFIYGLSALFGCNLIQSGVYEALMSTGLFLCICVLHYLNFKDTDAKKRAIADIVYYIMIICWFVGVIVHYSF